MNLLKDIIVDFVLFSEIEGFIFCLFFEKIGGCRKFKWYEWLILSVGNCLISQLLPPTIYQCVCVIWICLFLYKTNKLSPIKCLKLSIFGFLFFVVIEVLYSIIIENSIGIDLILLNNKFIVFIYLLIPKTIEFFICMKGKEIMKIIVGGVVRK